ncbi:hypothetical protein GCM10010472_19870 [Pseudonocardia halophobica]
MALLAAGQPAAQQQVVDLRGVQAGDLVEGGPDDLGGEVVGAHVLQRTLAGAADGRASGGDDHGVGHEVLRVSGGAAEPGAEHDGAEQSTPRRRPRLNRSRPVSGPEHGLLRPSPAIFDRPVGRLRGL